MMNNSQRTKCEVFSRSKGISDPSAILMLASFQNFAREKPLPKKTV